MKSFVEFYFPGIDLGGKCEREVSSRELAAIGSVPQYAISCRFFDKDEEQYKVNYSAYYFFGTEYSVEEFEKKYPQLAANFDLVEDANRIVKSVTGGFYPISENDIVIPA